MLDWFTHPQFMERFILFRNRYQSLQFLRPDSGTRCTVGEVVDAFDAVEH